MWDAVQTNSGLERHTRTCPATPSRQVLFRLRSCLHTCTVCIHICSQYMYVEVLRYTYMIYVYLSASTYIYYIYLRIGTCPCLCLLAPMYRCLCVLSSAIVSQAGLRSAAPGGAGGQWRRRAAAAGGSAVLSAAFVFCSTWKASRL